MSLKTTPWNIDEQLATPEAILGYLDAVFEDGDPALIAAALGDVARARGLAGAETLSKDTELASVIQMLKSMGLELRAGLPESREAA